MLPGEYMASMGPRPFSRGDIRHHELVAESRTPALQWGRDLSVAETAEQRAGVGACLARSFNGAATFQSRRLLFRRSEGAGARGLRLQWGPRPFSRGDQPTMGAVDPYGDFVSFNGAATFQSRRRLDEAARWRSGFLAALQWGRDLSVAETIYPVVTARRRIDRPLLQWGRDLSVAETYPEEAQLPHSERVRLGFNGAATFQSRRR